MSKKRLWVLAVTTSLFSLIIFPIIFNFVFMWDSGLASGKTSDWFTFFGNIVGSIIGGIFTYIALIYTFQNDKEEANKEKVFLTKDTILTCREYLNELTYFLQEVRESFNIDISRMDEQFKKQLNSKVGGIDVFFGNLSPDDVVSYQRTLKQVLEKTKALKNTFKERYIQLKEFEDEGFTKFLLDSYLAFAHYSEYIERVIISEETTSEEFVYSFINGYDNVGFRGLVLNVKSDIDGVYYYKYIEDNFVGEFMRNIEHTHIRG